MDSHGVIEEYLNSLRRMTSFTERTLTFHQHWCRQWNTFLDEKCNKTLAEAEPENLLQWMAFRQKEAEVKEATIRKELCVFRSLHGYLHNFGHTHKNPTKSLPELICVPVEEQTYFTVVP